MDTIIENSQEAQDESAGHPGGGSEGKQLGALLVYCGGMALALDGRLDGIAQKLGKSLHGQPFLGMMTYGEQASDFDGRNRHANLMYALLRFSD